MAFDGVRVLGERGTTILDRVDLTVPLDGISVLVGPSGAGKSTLLRLCNRLDVPTEGRVLLDGTDIDELDPVVLRRRVGMVFQRPVLFPGTVRDNFLVALPEGDDARFGEVLDHVGLGELSLDHAGRDLSGGEAQRVCLARTMLTDPEVLLADEPTSSLDVASRRSVELAVRRLANDGIAVIWVTHDMDQATRIADRKRVLLRGRIASQSEAAAYLADLVGHDDALERSERSEAPERFDPSERPKRSELPKPSERSDGPDRDGGEA